MAGVFNLLSSRANIHVFHIILRAVVIAEYNFIMDILNIIIRAWRLARWRTWSTYDVDEATKVCRMSCDVGEAMYGSASFSYPYIASPTSQLILQHFRRFTHVTAHSTDLTLLHLRHRHFTYVTAHSPTLPRLYPHHSSFYNPSIASPTSQVILQPFRCFTYFKGTSRTLPGEPPMHRGMKTVCGGLACYFKLGTKFRSSYSFG